MQMTFLTTGGGQWRANPNLYDSGKVRPIVQTHATSHTVGPNCEHAG